MKNRYAHLSLPFKMMATAVATLLFVTDGQAVEIETGNPDVNIRFDNTLKYSGGLRTGSPLARYVNPAAGGNMMSTDDGDQNFKKGSPISNRIDLLSELDFDFRKTIGFRVSGAAWYDTVYNRTNSNNSPGTANSLSVPYNEFTDATRNLHGRKAEILDAFVWANFKPTDEMRAQVKAGRHSLLWGESLFYSGNAIAGGMAPFDVIKLASVPSTPAKEFVMPVGQLSGQLQISPEWSVAAYWQYDWRRTRLPAAGSYFSSGDLLDAGGERIFVGPGPYLTRTQDSEPSSKKQFGFALKTRVEDADIGLYAIQYHAKLPQLAFNFVPSATSMDQGTYSLVFPERIRAFGASISQTVGNFNLAAEASIRHNSPLQSLPSTSFYGAPAISTSGNPLYAVGTTGHINVNALAML